MKSTALIALAATALSAFAANDPTNGATPPVLRPLEPSDSSVFRLPPPAPTVSKLRRVPVAPPSPTASPLATKLVLAPLPALPVIRTVTPAAPRPAPVSAFAPPVVPPATVGKVPPAPGIVTATAIEPPKPELPAEIAQEVAFYCQKQIGRWTEADARKLLGAPVHTRAAFDEKRVANGKIFGFHDPTSRYREVELDFESKTGTLRTVFVYPHKMSWQDVRRRWQGDVSTAEAPQGRKFYSYANRHMDVLVDADGKVISLGLY